jgi:hypothetical protein
MQKKRHAKDLTLQARLAQCREHTRYAEELAEIAQPGLREEYQKLAAHWRQLAAEIERLIEPASTYSVMR